MEKNMNKIRVFFLIIIALSILSGVSYSMGNIKGCAEAAIQKVNAQGNSKENKVKQVIPFTLKKLGSDEMVSLADFKGKPVFIDFWASWCPPCRAATPDVEKLHSMFKGRVQVLGINLDSSPEAGLKYVDKSGSGYMQLEGSNSDVSAKYGVSGIPAFFIIDTQGRLVNKWVGYSPNYMDKWVDTIQKLLK
jgi:cytochrome c biogenesis protein CcmG/thiol:disulfide interchange protein DsbE